MIQEHQQNDKKVRRQAKLALNNQITLISLKDVEGVELVQKQKTNISTRNPQRKSYGLVS